MIDTETGPRKLTYAQFKARKKRREIVHPLVTDDDAVINYRGADEALRRARGLGDSNLIPQLEQEKADAEQAVRDATLLLRLRALPRAAYAALIAEHPPQTEDNTKAQEYTDNPKAKALWHTATFGPALVAACLIEPEVTVEEATEMAADLNDAEWDALLSAAIGVNQAATDTAGLVFS